MPRNGSGSCSLAEAAFIANTPISSADVNADFDDIIVMLTDSLSRAGDGGMQAVLKLDNTGFTYLTDPNTGMSRNGADEQVITCGSVDVATFTSTYVDLLSLKINGTDAFPIVTADITNAAVTYAKIQHVAASSLLGNPTGVAIAPEEITLGAGLAFSGTTLVGSGIVPTIQTFTSGTAQTYTTPAGVKWIEVLLTGGGAGGGGGNQTTLSTAGGATSFGALTASGGAGSSYNVAGTGGAASGGNVSNMAGAPGGTGNAPGLNHNSTGGAGGCSQLGGAGAGTNSNGTGAAATTNSGSGGGGGGSTNASLDGAAGCGGASGGTVRHIYTSPAATYSYTVGAGGAGAAGTSINSSAGGNGGAGAAGRIQVIEHY